MPNPSDEEKSYNHIYIGWENYRTSGKKSSHVESSWLLAELTEGAVTVEGGSLFKNLATHT